MNVNKLLLPFLMGVIMKIASIVPVILSIMGALALSALMAGKGSLVLAGLIGKATLNTLPTK
jgi:nicotinamide riboside transporter PnuC